MSNKKAYTPYTFATSFDELEKSDLQLQEEEREAAEEAEKERLRLEQEALNAPPPPPTFSEEELAAAKTEAREEGYAKGHAEALEKIEQETLTALQTITGYMAVLQDQQALANESRSAALVRIASDMVSRLMPAYARTHGVEEIKSLVYSSLAPLETKGRINITLPENLCQTIREQLENIAHEAGFEGKLMYHPDAKMGASDVRVDWGRGSAERDLQAAFEEMHKLVEQFLETHLHKGEDESKNESESKSEKEEETNVDLSIEEEEPPAQADAPSPQQDEATEIDETADKNTEPPPSEQMEALEEMDPSPRTSDVDLVPEQPEAEQFQAEQSRPEPVVHTPEESNK